MTEIDSGLATQIAVTQQKFGIAALKNAANTEKALADVISQTVEASGRGQRVNLFA
jgi:hypothetical protein